MILPLLVQWCACRVMILCQRIVVDVSPVSTKKEIQVLIHLQGINCLCHDDEERNVKGKEI